MIVSCLFTLLSHWYRNPLQIFAYLSGVALATALWSGVQAINHEAKVSYRAAAQTLGEGQYDLIRPKQDKTISVVDYVNLRKSGWLESPVEDGYLDNPETTLSIALNITLEKLKDKKEDALAKYAENNWSFNELENYLKKGIDIYSIEEYVKNDFAKNKNIITGNDYFNVIKVFKKHLNKVNISFNDLLDNNTILEFKLKAQRNGVKVSSVNSYIKKIGVIMNQAVSYTHLTLPTKRIV